MQTWLNRAVCLRHDDVAAPPMECLLPCCRAASSQPRKSAERATRARASGKERGRLGHMGAPTFLSARRVRNSSSVSPCPSAPIRGGGGLRRSALVAAPPCCGRGRPRARSVILLPAFFRIIRLSACLSAVPSPPFGTGQAGHRQARLAGNQPPPEHQNHSGAVKTGVRTEK